MEIIENNVGVISQHGKSGMLAWETPPRYQMSDKTAYYSLTWCAGTIAHDAYHSFLYKKYLPNNGNEHLTINGLVFHLKDKQSTFNLK